MISPAEQHMIDAMTDDAFDHCQQRTETMNEPWKPEAGNPALVMVAEITDHHSTLIGDDSYGGGRYRMMEAENAR